MDRGYGYELRENEKMVRDDASEKAVGDIESPYGRVSLYKLKAKYASFEFISFDP